MPITGEIKVILVNLSDTPFEIKPGERIAQIVVARHERVEWEASETLSDTARGAGGFGSTEDRLRTCPRHRCRFRRKGREEHEVCGCHRTGGGEGDAAPQCRGGACKPCPALYGRQRQGNAAPRVGLCTVYQLYGPARRRQLRSVSVVYQDGGTGSSGRAFRLPYQYFPERFAETHERCLSAPVAGGGAYDGGYFDEQMWYGRIGLDNQQGLIAKREADEIIRKLSLRRSRPSTRRW